MLREITRACLPEMGREVLDELVVRDLQPLSGRSFCDGGQSGSWRLVLHKLVDALCSRSLTAVAPRSTRTPWVPRSRETATVTTRRCRSRLAQPTCQASAEVRRSDRADEGTRGPNRRPITSRTSRVWRQRGTPPRGEVRGDSQPLLARTLASVQHSQLVLEAASRGTARQRRRSPR